MVQRMGKTLSIGDQKIDSAFKISNIIGVKNVKNNPNKKIE
jgi:hypothetical protein